MLIFCRRPPRAPSRGRPLVLDPPPGAAALFLAGALTGLTGIATSEVVRSLLHREAGPVVAVAEAARDLTPGAIAVPLVESVRHLDKPLLVTGTVVALLAVAGVAGILHVRRPWLANLLLTALAGVALVALLSRDGSSEYDVVPLAVGFITWLIVLPWLCGAARIVETSPARRAFLLRAAGVGAVSVVGIGLARVIGRGREKVEQARELLRLPVGSGSAPAGADLGVSSVPWRTQNAKFYQIDTALALPEITPDTWELRIHGMVDHPFSITYDELVSRKMSEHWITLCCVSNEVGGDYISNAFFSGIPIRDLLKKAGVQAGADAVKQTSQDGWTCGTPLAALTDPNRDALLAVAMNGAPLPIEHGFPVRMVVPGLYGYVSATKWVVDLEVTRFADFQAYWTDRGWGVKGPVKTESRIDVPRDGAAVQAGGTRFAGVAWAQHTGIEKVEVQLDGGRWQTAELGAVPNDDTWVQWVLSADVGKGEHALVVRATDRSGYTQTAARADVLPDGATGWHSVRFDVS